MGQFATGDFVGTQVKAQRWFDSRELEGKVDQVTLGQIFVSQAGEPWQAAGDRFIFHLEGNRSRARVIAEYVRFENGRHVFKRISHLEYQPPRHELRHPVDGVLVEICMGEQRERAFVADVSASGLGILTDHQLMRGLELDVCLEADSTRSIQAEVRYSVKSTLAPTLFRTGLSVKSPDWGEGGLWTRFLRAA